MDRIDIGERIGAALLAAMLAIGVLANLEPGAVRWIVQALVG